MKHASRLLSVSLLFFGLGLLAASERARAAASDSGATSARDFSDTSDQDNEETAQKRRLVLRRVIRGNCLVDSVISADPCFHVALLIYDKDISKAFRTVTRDDGTFGVLVPDLKSYHIEPAAKSYMLDPRSPTLVQGGDPVTITLKIR